jgi:hypothetical protein
MARKVIVWSPDLSSSICGSFGLVETFTPKPQDLVEYRDFATLEKMLKALQKKHQLLLKRRSLKQ